MESFKILNQPKEKHRKKKGHNKRKGIKNNMERDLMFMSQKN